MDRDVLLAHIRATHFESGDRDRAEEDTRRIARFLKRSGARSVVGIGSAFDRTAAPALLAAELAAAPSGSDTYSLRARGSIG